MLIKSTDNLVHTKVFFKIEPAKCQNNLINFSFNFRILRYKFIKGKQTIQAIPSDAIQGL